MTQLTSKKITTPLSATIKVPGDKSISHRALIFGSLAIGETIISGLLEGEDVLHTAQAMKAMGAKIEHSSDGLWRVYGTGVGGLKQPEHVLEMGNSGTSTRLLIGLVGTHNITTSFTGDASLTRRPMNRVIEPLTKMGATFEASEGGRLPLTVHGTPDPLRLEYQPARASAQVKSAILLAGLNTRGRTTVIEAKPTRDHTEKMFEHFGVTVEIEDKDDGMQHISVVGPQDLQPCAVDIPGDPSSAAFIAVAAAIMGGSHIEISHVCINERRIGLFTSLQEMGADIEYKYKRVEAGEDVADIIIRGGTTLKGIDVPPSRVPSMIDEFPILAMAAACAEGTTTMTGLAELRVKESDRLLMVYNGLKKCGAHVEMGEDSLTIHGIGQPPAGLSADETPIETALDHRIAMSFLVLGSVTDNSVTIDDGAPIKTSFPNFVELMNEIGLNISG